MDKVKEEYIRAWLQKADHDLKNAVIILNAEEMEKPFDTVCFHCQQAAEKYLKGYLVYLDVLFPHTHNIAQLIELGAKVDSELRAYISTDELTPYGVDIRYPDDLYLPSEEEAWQAYHLALSLKDHVVKSLQEIL